MLLYKTKSLSKEFLNKKVSILSSPKIKNKIDKNNFLNIDIIKSNEDNNIIAFSDNNYLKLFKNYTKHPYEISHIKIEDFIYYLQKTNNKLLLIDNILCNNNTKKFYIDATLFNLEENYD